jgi:hypothetical protein
MRTLLSAIAAAAVALVLAAGAVWGVVNSNTKAPSSNPAGVGKVVQYGP